MLQAASPWTMADRSCCDGHISAVSRHLYPRLQSRTHTGAHSKHMEHAPTEDVDSTGRSSWTLPRLRLLPPLAASQARPSAGHSHGTIHSEGESDSDGAIELEPRFGHILAGDVICRTPTSNSSRARLQHTAHESDAGGKLALESSPLAVSRQRRASAGGYTVQHRYRERSAAGQQPVLLRIRPVCEAKTAGTSTTSRQLAGTGTHVGLIGATATQHSPAGGGADRHHGVACSRDSTQPGARLLQEDSPAWQQLSSPSMCGAGGALCEPFPSFSCDVGACRIELAHAQCADKSSG